MCKFKVENTMVANSMAFEKLDFKRLSEIDMIKRSQAFYEDIVKRRTVRDFSDENVPIEIIFNAIKSASSSPSGANKQPWYFVVVKDPKVKREIPWLLICTRWSRRCAFNGIENELNGYLFIRKFPHCSSFYDILIKSL